MLFNEMLHIQYLRRLNLLVWGIVMFPGTHAVTRRYNFTISRGIIAPDGVEKSAILVNGQYPGPLLEANWKDTIEVTVHNQIEAPEEGTSLHWHGLTQKDTPWSDGAPAINQCPIPPGHSYTYSFVADKYGSSWYHSHYSAQYTDGVLGPLIVHGPAHIEYDIELEPIVLTDWFRSNYTSAVKNLLSKQAVPQFSAGNLINGKSFANYNGTLTNASHLSPKDISTFTFQSGKTHLLRFINAGAEGFQHVSLDGHEMVVVAVDFTPVKPFNTTVLKLGTGQRVDVLVQALDDDTASYWLRTYMQPQCNIANQPYGLAAVYYPSADRSKVPRSMGMPNGNDDTSCLGPPIATTVPVNPTKPIHLEPTIKTIDIQYGPDASGVSRFYMDNRTFIGNYSTPILSRAYERGRYGPNFDPDWNVIDFGGTSAIRLIVTTSLVFPHPLHLHGHSFWVLAEGTGTWDGTITNPDNPIYRDTHMIAGGTPAAPSYTVLQFETDNPGVWPFHCHSAWHMALGMWANILERPSELEGRVVPAEAQRLCQVWAAYIARTGSSDSDIETR